jgi:hypothetical protein
MAGTATYSRRSFEQADSATITRWWTQWPPNLICLDCGKSKSASSTPIVRVNLTHHRNGFQPAFKSFFGCDVAFGSAADEIAFPSIIQPTPLASADPFLHAMLIAQCEQMHVDRLRPAALRASVENEIAPLFAARNPRRNP